jgi:hypothetical protein
MPPTTSLSVWGLDEAIARKRMYRAPTARERERWHAVWLVNQGWNAAKVARSLGRDPHTIGAWLDSFRPHGPATLTFDQTGGSPLPDARAASDAGSGRPSAPKASRVAAATWSW